MGQAIWCWRVTAGGGGEPQEGSHIKPQWEKLNIGSLGFWTEAISSTAFVF